MLAHGFTRAPATPPTPRTTTTRTAICKITPLLLMVAGCSGYQVRYETPTSIAVWHDPVRSSQATAQAVAQAHCDKFGRNAVPVASSGGVLDGITTSFDCRP